MDILNKMLEQDLIKLMQECNHPSLDLNDVKSLCQLVQLAEDVSNPGLRAAKWLDDLPAAVGDKWLVPITIGKAIWYDNHIAVWFKDDLAMLMLSLAFVLCRDVSRETLSTIQTSDDCQRIVSAWWDGSNAKFNELTDAIERLMPVALGNGKKDDTPNYGPIIRFLVREYGGVPEYWLHHESAIMIQNLVNSYIQEQAKETERNRSAMLKAGMSVPTSPFLVDAIKAYRNAINELREQWQTKT